MDKQLGESRAYKLHTQPTEKKSPIYLLTIEVKQVFKGQDVDALHTIVQDLLRGGALIVLNNKQAMFNKQSQENLEHYLNALTVQVFAYKLLKRVIKLSNYLTEFSTPTGIEAKKLEDEEILE
eukprot:11052736-Ditylum_brightwellii.AAC.1